MTYAPTSSCSISVVLNMSAPPRHFAILRPVRLARSMACAAMVADLGETIQYFRDPQRLAAHLLQRLGLPPGADALETLRRRIDENVEARGLRGCATVRPASRDETALMPIADPALVLVLLAKSSDVVWVARKRPVIDRETLGRRLFTRDARFLGSR